MRLWRAWVALWDRREDPTHLALVRIAVGVVLVVDLLLVWHHGLIAPLYAPPPEGYATASSLDPHALWLIATLSAAALAAGALTPLACVTFVLTSAHLGHLNPDADRGIDMMLRVAIAILALSRCNARFSIDARFMRARPAAIPAWPRYLIMVQLVWIYFSGGINKGGAEWGPAGGFTALGNVLADPHFARFDPAWIEAVHPLTRIATAATIAFELTAPVYLWLYYVAATPERTSRLRALVRRLHLRRLWLGFGASFHLGIALTMTMGIFPWGMLALYPALLIPAGTPPRPRTAPRPPADPRSGAAGCTSRSDPTSTPSPS